MTKETENISQIVWKVKLIEHSDSLDIEAVGGTIKDDPMSMDRLNLMSSGTFSWRWINVCGTEL